MEGSEFGWPADPAPRAGGARVETEIAIHRPAAMVFDYVTAPVLWHTWHPATVKVEGAPERPLETGESVVETIAGAGRRADARWTVLACQAPQLWVIATDNESGAARIVYRIAAADEGCRFHRTLEFRSKAWPWKLLDANFLTWVLNRQSAKALSNLKRVLEA